MLIKRYGEYILLGRKEAALNAFLWSMIPFMGWLSVAIVSLVTLRRGAFEGFIVLLCTTMPSLILALMGHHNWLIYGVLGGSFVSWILSVVLRERHSWSWVLQFGALLAILVVAAVHWFVPDINQYWFGLYSKFYSEADKALAMQVSPEQLKVLAQVMAKLTMGILAITLLLMDCSYVLIARWWQASLFNPKGLAQELYSIRFSPWAVLTFVAVVFATVMGIALAWDLLPILVIVFFIAGLSLIHALAKSTNAMVPLLLGFYAILILFFRFIGPLAVLLVILLAVMDVFIDFRGRIKHQAA